MELKTFTIDDIRSYDPCYDPAKYLPENWQGTALDILDIDDCPIEDRFWVVLRDEWIPEATLREFARWCALQVIDLWDAPDVVRECLETGNEELSAAAWSAAGDAARSAAWGATRSADWAAAWAAAWAASRSAAWSVAKWAAWSATRSAAWGAARSAAWSGQLEHLKTLCSQSQSRLDI